METGASDRSYKKLFTNAAWKFSAFAVPFLCDTPISSVIFLVLLYFMWLFHLGRVVGLKQDQADAFEVLHFWLDYGVFAAVGVSFCYRILVGIFRDE